METCLDEGTLQAYLDGELSPETLNNVALHLAACAACAQAAHAAEQELAHFNAAFAPALSANVPTAKLRARLDEAIAGMNAPQRGFATMPAASRLRSIYASLVASLTTFTPRQATAFASFLVAVALVVVFFALIQTPDGQKTTGGEVAGNNQPSAPASSPAAPVANRETPDAIAAVTASSGDTKDKEFDSPAPVRVRRDDRAMFVKAGLNNRQPARTPVDGGNAEAGNTTVAAAAKPEPVLEDEKTYISSIASLTSAIEAQGASGLTPTLRAEYERNLAVVNQAIISSRVAARRNPQDTDAKEFLRAAYQNKVELLSAVADQAQIASSRD
ncbi:MAG TPA: zf-HC2 domain-containing protein [Pyrinomonadaceae bacterium]|jgi:anti-sigma factor RsiW|nr:zf-HC2 domain-containing protein [Pyrinomonadaceae bacterium]